MADAEKALNTAFSTPRHRRILERYIKILMRYCISTKNANGEVLLDQLQVTTSQQGNVQRQDRQQETEGLASKLVRR